MSVSASHTTNSSSSSSSNSSSSAIAFMNCEKQIRSPMQIMAWKGSEAHADIVGFILSVNEKIKGKSKSTIDQKALSARVSTLLSWLSECKAWIADIPPLPQAMRFGNKAFRTWHAKLLENIPPLLSALLPSHLSGASTELSAYLSDAFGSPVRIDYGTGHELNFILFVICLYKLKVLSDEDILAVILLCFDNYLDLMRELQHVYWLEPAGSKGAWGLDDYQFLCFLWGAAQLIHSPFPPSSILNRDLVEKHKSDYLMFGAIAFIHKMKTGPFSEHSSMLYQMSGSSSWEKANSGLIRMYDDEVLLKFPVVQHIVFGSLLRFVPYDEKKGTLATSKPKMPPPSLKKPIANNAEANNTTPAPTPASATATAAEKHDKDDSQVQQ